MATLARRFKRVPNTKPARRLFAKRKSAAPAGSGQDQISEEVVQERIRERAYLLFESRGYAHGFDHNDWLEAEAQIRREVGTS